MRIDRQALKRKLEYTRRVALEPTDPLTRERLAQMIEELESTAPGANLKAIRQHTEPLDAFRRCLTTYTFEQAFCHRETLECQAGQIVSLRAFECPLRVVGRS